MVVFQGWDNVFLATFRHAAQNLHGAASFLEEIRCDFDDKPASSGDRGCFALCVWLRRGTSPLVVVLGVAGLIGFGVALGGESICTLSDPPYHSWRGCRP